MSNLNRERLFFTSEEMTEMDIGRKWTEMDIDGNGHFKLSILLYKN